MSFRFNSIPFPTGFSLDIIDVEFRGHIAFCMTRVRLVLKLGLSLRRLLDPRLAALDYTDTVPDYVVVAAEMALKDELSVLYTFLDEGTIDLEWSLARFEQELDFLLVAYGADLLVETEKCRRASAN